jgi:hypothetical protein
VRVLERVFPSASTQTYSARQESLGKGKAANRSMTDGSKLDCPVVFPRTADMRTAEGLRWKLDGAKADDWAALKAIAREKTNFMLMMSLEQNYEASEKKTSSVI